MLYEEIMSKQSLALPSTVDLAKELSDAIKDINKSNIFNTRVSLNINVVIRKLWHIILIIFNRYYDFDNYTNLFVLRSISKKYNKNPDDILTILRRFYGKLPNNIALLHKPFPEPDIAKLINVQTTREK
jgi:hypothetical protein